MYKKADLCHYMVEIAEITESPHFPGMISREQVAGARAMLGWKQADLAERAGVSVSTIKDYEAGRRSPRGDSLKRIQDAFEAAGIRPIDADAWGGQGVRFLE